MAPSSGGHRHGGIRALAIHRPYPRCERETDGGGQQGLRMGVARPSAIL